MKILFVMYRTQLYNRRIINRYIMPKGTNKHIEGNNNRNVWFWAEHTAELNIWVELLSDKIPLM